MNGGTGKASFGPNAPRTHVRSHGFGRGLERELRECAVGPAPRTHVRSHESVSGSERELREAGRADRSRRFGYAKN